MSEALFFTQAHDATVSTTVDGTPVTFKVSEHKVGRPLGFRLNSKGEQEEATDFDLSGVVGIVRGPFKCDCDKDEKKEGAPSPTGTRRALRESAASADDDGKREG